MWFKRIKSDQWCSITTKILKSLPLVKNQLYLLKRLLYNHNYGHTASWMDLTSNVHGFGEHLPHTWKGCTEMWGPQDPLFTPILLFTRPTVEVQVHSQDPQWRKMWYFATKIKHFQKIWQFLAPEAQIWPRNKSERLKILQNISSKAPVFRWKSAHKTPLSQQFIHSQAPKFENLSFTCIQEKKSRVPPRPLWYGTNSWEI